MVSMGLRVHPRKEYPTYRGELSDGFSCDLGVTYSKRRVADLYFFSGYMGTGGEASKDIVVHSVRKSRHKAGNRVTDGELVHALFFYCDYRSVSMYHEWRLA